MTGDGRPQVLLITTLVVLVATVGLAAGFPLVKSKYRRSRDVFTLMGAVQSLKRCALDPTAWTATMNDPKNSGLRCVFEKDGCANERPVAIHRLLTGHDRLCLPGYDLENPGVGLTEDGVRCDGYTTKGNSKCPYRIDLAWEPHCREGAKTCANPVEEIVFAVGYHPDSKLEGGAPLLGDGVTRTGFEDRQTFAIPRVERSGADSVVIAEIMPPASPGGPCPPGPKPTRRNMNVVLADPEGRAATDKDGTFWMRRGQYDCRLSTPGFKVGHFRSVLIDLTTKQPLLGTSDEYTAGALVAAQTRAAGSTRLILDQPKNHLAVVQYCDEVPSGPPALANLAFGVPMGIGPEVYSTLECHTVPEEDL